MKNHNFVFSETQINEISCLFSNEELISKGNKYALQFGLAQKIVNMSYKYFYVFSDYLFDDESLPSFSKCHCPLDSIILNKASIKNSKYSAVVEPSFQPEKPMKSAFPLYAIQTRKG